MFECVVVTEDRTKYIVTSTTAVARPMEDAPGPSAVGVILRMSLIPTFMGLHRVDLVSPKRYIYPVWCDVEHISCHKIPPSRSC